VNIKTKTQRTVVVILEMTENEAQSFYNETSGEITPIVHEFTARIRDAIHYELHPAVAAEPMLKSRNSHGSTV